MLAGSDAVLKVSSCNEAKPLLAILGYRMREMCGPKTAVETSDPDRAFLTIDSGFPLAELEETLRGGKPFIYSYRSSPVPVFLAPNDWVVGEKVEREAKKRAGDDALDYILRDPAMARLYWALSRIDPATVAELKRYPGLANLIPVAAALDFYGTQISIRGGRVAVPGGKQSESAWKELAGASPENPGEFIPKLLAKDEGWLASYFDVLSRLNRSQQAYFADAHRLPRFYEALRGNDISPSPARPVFRPEPGLLLLTTLLEIEPNGQPHIPGGVDVWKQIVAAHRKDDSKITKEWAKRASHWSNPGDVAEGMVGLSRVNEAGTPLQIFVAMSEIDAGKTGGERLTPQTVKLLADRFSRFGDQYAIFSEFSGLNNASITRFMSAADAINKISDHAVRGNAMGIFQANVGIWEILARQGEIPSAKLNDSWQKTVGPLAAVHSSVQLFDAGKASWNDLIRAVAGKTDLSQDEVIALLAGPNQSSPDAQQVRQDLASRLRTVMDDQRLLSLDTIFGVGDGLTVMSQGRPAPDALLGQAQQIHEFQMPRPFFTTTERNEWAAGFYNTSHATLQMRTDLTKIIKSPGSPEELGEARGQLAPFLRDTLVGLNYAYYEPPAAQALHNNPMLVRSHDFSGEMTPGSDETWKVPRVFGRGWTASGGAHLTGSLADLPYVLAQLEQDFTVPENVQALIWDELVPGLVSGAVTSRWWGITRNELHAAALYQQAGEQILLAAAKNQTVRENAMNVLAERMLIDRAARVNERLAAGHAEDLVLETAPAEKFYLAAEYRRSYPSVFAAVGPAAKELDALIRSNPDEANLARLSRDFGAPHPILKQSYGSELLNLKPFPSFMGYPSRLLAETWDSDNLYWARLADERGYAPETLNNVVPVLTHRMVEKIFATDFEDWPAMLRAMRETGDEFRRGKIDALPKVALSTTVQ